MSSGASQNPEARHYRRRKRYQGATWAPADTSAALGDGAWCKHCKIRHGYKNGMNITYQLDSHNNWLILWMCKKTHNVLEVTTIRRAEHVSVGQEQDVRLDRGGSEDGEA